jgi:siroheme synthase
MMYGASADTDVTLVENVSRPHQRIVQTSLATLPEAAAQLAGPAVILYGLAPRQALAETQLNEATA